MIRRVASSLRVGSISAKVGAHSFITSKAATSLQQECKPTYSDDEYAQMDWDNLGFGLVPTDFMFMTKCSEDGRFEQGELSRYGSITLSPSAGVLNYGQGIYEGTKAFRKKDGRLLLFRPEQSALRMKFGGKRMCMPSPSVDLFVDAVKQTVLANKRWVPPHGKGSLYIRPLLMGSGSVLGLAPSPEYTFLVYASPVGNYFKEGLGPLNLVVEDEYHRATPGGTGGVKAIGNYASALKAVTKAKKGGFSDVIYLDSINKKYLEEVSASNIFIIKGNTISTPAINGTILPGITRKCIIEIALDYGYKVEERSIAVDELIDAEEVFCTGTAVVVAPVGSITYQDKRIELKTGADSVSQKLYNTVVGIQTGLIEDKRSWTVEMH